MTYTPGQFLDVCLQRYGTLFNAFCKGFTSHMLDQSNEDFNAIIRAAEGLYNDNIDDDGIIDNNADESIEALEDQAKNLINYLPARYDPDLLCSIYMLLIGVENLIYGSKKEIKIGAQSIDYLHEKIECMVHKLNIALDQIKNIKNREL